MDNNIFSPYLYEANIINQQITYYVLKEEYDNLRNGVITEESSSGAATWIKDKLSKFVKFIKAALEKITTFITKTFPEWVKKVFDKVLIFLKIKKEPTTINTTKIEQVTNTETKNKVTTEISKANSANAKINKHQIKQEIGAAPKMASIAPVNQSSSNSNVKKQSAETKEEKSIVQEAEKQVEESCKNLEKIAATTDSAEIKQEIETAVKAIKKRRYVVAVSSPKYAKPTGLRGTFLKLDDVDNYISALKETEITFANYYYSFLSEILADMMKIEKREQITYNSWNGNDDDYQSLGQHMSHWYDKSTNKKKKTWHDMGLDDLGNIPEYKKELAENCEKANTSQVKARTIYENIYCEFGKLEKIYNSAKYLSTPGNSAKNELFQIDCILKRLDDEKIIRLYSQKTIANVTKNISRFANDYAKIVNERTGYATFILDTFNKFVTTAKPATNSKGSE